VGKRDCAAEIPILLIIGRICGIFCDLTTMHVSLPSKILGAMFVWRLKSHVEQNLVVCTLQNSPACLELFGDDNCGAWAQTQKIDAIREWRLYLEYSLFWSK